MRLSDLEEIAEIVRTEPGNKLGRISVTTMVKRLGVKLFSYEGEQDAMFVATYNEANEKALYINEKSECIEYASYIALAHIILHSETKSKFAYTFKKIPQNDEHYWACERLGSMLLLPKETTYFLFERCNQDADLMAERINMDKRAVYVRLDTLDLLDRRDMPEIPQPSVESSRGKNVMSVR